MGLAIDYGDHWKEKNWIEESAIVTFDLVPAISYRFSDKFSLGLGLDILWGKIRQQFGEGTVDSNGQISYDDSTLSLGFNIGLLYNLSSEARLGIKWRSPIDLEFKNDPSFSKMVRLRRYLIQK